MPTAPDNTIDLANPDATELDANKGSTVAWHNSTTSVISLNPPSCVSPSNELDIAAGATSRTFTINGNKGSTYDYTFDVGAELGTRSGKIKVND